MRRFNSPGQAGMFCFAHDPIYGHFRPAQHRMDAAAHQVTLTDRHRCWNDITATLLAERAANALASFGVLAEVHLPNATVPPPVPARRCIHAQDPTRSRLRTGPNQQVVDASDRAAGFVRGVVDPHRGDPTRPGRAAASWSQGKPRVPDTARRSVTPTLPT
ncbi:MAG: hypothetical protein ACXVXN_08845 [Mycobacteriaceae bacterium]